MFCQNSNVAVTDGTAFPGLFSSSTVTRFPKWQCAIFCSTYIYYVNSTEVSECYWLYFTVSTSDSVRFVPDGVNAPAGVIRLCRLLVMCRLQQAYELMTFKKSKNTIIVPSFSSSLPTWPPLLSSFHPNFSRPHIPKTILCSFQADFFLVSNLVCQLFFISWHLSSLSACYTADSVRDILSQLCLNCKPSDGTVEDMVKIK